MIPLRFIPAAAQFMAYAVPAAAVVPVHVPARPIGGVGAVAYDFVGSAVTTDVIGRSYEQVLIRGHVVTLGDKSRIDIDEAGSANGSMRGSYMLLSEGGNKIFWVNPMAREYRETDSQSMLSGLNEMSNGSNGLITIQASNVRIEAQKIGTGPIIQGHNTVHYRLSQHMDMMTKVLSKTATTHDNQVIDYYYATDLPNFINPFLSSAPSLSQNGTLFGDDYNKQLRTAVDKLYQGGAPLRTIVNAKSTDAMGRVQTTITITEVTNVHHVDVNVLTFSVPTGYAKAASPQASNTGLWDNDPLDFTPTQVDAKVQAADMATSVYTSVRANGLQEALSH